MVRAFDSENLILIFRSVTNTEGVRENGKKKGSARGAVETATTVACAAQTMAPIANRFVPITAFLIVALEGYLPNGAPLPDEHHEARRISQNLFLLL